LYEIAGRRLQKYVETGQLVLRHSEQQFEHGASDLFGEELPGLWLSKKKRSTEAAMHCMTTTVFLYGRTVGAVFFRGHQLDEESFAT
jgi:hypothetical protein